MLQRDDALLDVVLELSRAEDDFRHGELTYLVHREGGAVDRAPLFWNDQLQDDLAALGRPDPELRQRFGDRLRALLGQAEWGAREAQIAAALAEGRRVHVTIRASAPELYRLPWELLTIKATGAHLGELPGSLVQYEWPAPAEEVPPNAPAHEGGRILFAWSAAGGAVPAAEHLAVLRRASAEGLPCFDPRRDVIADVSLAALHDALAAPAPPVAVLHLLCHGGRLDAASESYGLVWSGPSGGPPVLVDASALRRVLEPHRGTLRLVVLSACYGGHAGAPGNALGAVALELHRVGIAAVVASREPLSVPGSITLTETLYRRLVVDLASLEEAFLAARGRLALDATSGDWASLQLYARAAAGGDTRPLVVRPFRGLLVFAAEHRRFFFGRDAEIAEVVADLAALPAAGRPRFLVVAGASGTGKSSMVLAGAVPRLVEAPGARWELAYLRPGRDPEQALAAALDHWRDRTRALLLVVDQLEEVFTATTSAEARRRFLRRLWALAGDARSGVHVILTLRVDFIGRCGEVTLDDRDLRLDQVAYDERHRVFVAQMTRAQFEAAITGPAHRVGLRFDAGLVARLLDDTGGEPGALPLLEDTLDLLWQRRSGRVLTQAAYDAVGGLAGALHGRADQLVDGLGESERRAARRLLVHLVGFHGDEALATRRRALVDELRPGDAAEAERFDRVLARLVDARLLVRGDEGGKASVEVAHEALIRRWARLGTWVREDRDKLLQIEKIAGWVAEWKARKALLAAGQLAYAEEAAQRWPEDLGAPAKELIAASRALAARKNRRWSIVTAVFAAAAVVLLLLCGISLLEWVRAVDEARKARDVARVAVAGRAGSGATVATLMLREIGEKDLGEVPGWLEAVPFSSPAYLTRRLLKGHGGLVRDASWSPDGARIATASDDHTVRVWSAADGTHHELKGHTDVIFQVAWSPDGTRLVTASEDRTARVWNADGSSPVVLKGHRGMIFCAAWSPDGKRVATGSLDGTARVWNATDGTFHELSGHTKAVYCAAWSPDGTRIVTSSLDKTARVWSSEGGPPIATLEGHTARVTRAAWSPDGTHVVTTSDDHTARLWSAAGGPSVATLPHSNVVKSVAWSPDGTHIVTASADRTARVWRADGHLVHALEGHAQAIVHAAFSPDGTRVVTASDDDTARVWNVADGRLLTTLEGHLHRVTSAAWSPDGLAIVTSSYDETARVWEADERLASRPARPRTGAAASVERARPLGVDGKPGLALRGLTAVVVHEAWSADGKQGVTVAGDHTTAQVWNGLTGEPGALLVGHWEDIESVAWNAAATRVVTASADGTARLWRAGDGAVLAVLDGHGGEVKGAAFKDGDKQVVTVRADGTEQEWTIDPQLVQRALWLSTPYCFDADDRMRLLREAKPTAVLASRACETMSKCLRDAHGKPVEARYPACLEGFRKDQARAER